MYVGLAALVIASVALSVTNKLYTKTVLSTVDPVIASFWVNVFAALTLFPVALPILLTTPFPHGAGLVFCIAVTLWAMSGIISNVSIRKSDITLREPILALRIPLTAFLGVIVLEEHLAGTQVIGIGMIFVGVLLATWKGWKRSDLLTPEGGWVVLSAWVSSVAFLIDKVALGHFTPVLYAFFMFLFPGLVQAIFLSPTYRRSVTVCKRHFGQLFMLGVLCASIYWVNLEIMSQLPLSIAYSITQIGVVATVIGAVFVLHERERLWFRVAGVLIVCVGALLFKVV